jgi:hypothetical protein
MDLLPPFQNYAPDSYTSISSSILSRDGSCCGHHAQCRHAASSLTAWLTATTLLPPLPRPACPPPHRPGCQGIGPPPSSPTTAPARPPWLRSVMPCGWRWRPLECEGGMERWVQPAAAPSNSRAMIGSGLQFDSHICSVDISGICGVNIWQPQGPCGEGRGRCFEGYEVHTGT